MAVNLFQQVKQCGSILHLYAFQMLLYGSTNAKNIEAEALIDGLVDQLIWEAVKAHMASQGQVSVSIILRIISHKQIIFKIFNPFYSQTIPIGVHDYFNRTFEHW